MNLKEEIALQACEARDFDNSTQVLTTNTAITIAESYAKEKAWKCVLHFKYMGERIIEPEFNKWWEETK